MHKRTTTTVPTAVQGSDADLTALIRDGSSPAAEAALDELYRRHRNPVLAYARTCTPDPHTAEDLVSEAFARALQAVRNGSGPQEAWRPYLLTTVRNTATAWALTARRTELAPDFDTWLSDSPAALGGEDRMLRQEEADRAVRAFRSLPSRWQTALWHSAVEGESPKQIAPVLGLSPSGAASLTARAREGLREAYLAEHVRDATDSDECRHYVGLMAASMRSARGRRSSHLERHLEGCARCRHAWTELRDVNRLLGTALPAGILLWVGGSSWLKTAGAAGGASFSSVAAGGGKAGMGPGVALKAGAGGASVLALAIGAYVSVPDDGKRQTQPAVPQLAVQPSIPGSSPSSSPTSALMPALSTSRSASTTSPSWSPPATDRTQLRIADTGRCMDIGTAAGAQPYEAVCSGSPTQQWDLLVNRTAQEVRIRNHATGMCLTNTASKADAAPVRQQPDVCTSTAAAAGWSYCLYPGQVAFIEKGLALYRLGLNDWHTAESNSAHSPAIGTTANYYDTPSLRFLYAGRAFSG
jgi:RNA polymerase sigma factor (sigma-70 family)